MQGVLALRKLYALNINTLKQSSLHCRTIDKTNLKSTFYLNVLDRKDRNSA